MMKIHQPEILITKTTKRKFSLHRNISKLCVVTFVLFSTVIPANAAFAQSGQETALADQLFEQGIDLESKGKVAEACEKFEESRQLAPRPGTLYYLGACYEKLGRRASARAMFLDAADAAALAKDQEGALKARQKADALLPVAKLIISVQQPVEGLEVTIDGKPVGRSSWGAEVPVDSGKHTIRAVGPGTESWEKIVTVDDDGARVSVEVPKLALQKRTNLSRQKIAALSIGAAGIVGLGIGGAFGIKAIVCKGDKTECSRNDFDTYTTGANVGFIVGGVAVASAAVLWLIAPTNKSVPKSSLHVVPMVGPGNAGGVFVGAF